MKNAVWCDFNPGEQWDFLNGINDSTNLEFIEMVYINNKMSTKSDNLIRYAKYIWFGFIQFINRKEYGIIVSWQQFFGIFFAFFCRLFHIKKTFNLFLMVFIYIPKKNLIGKLYKAFIKYAVDSPYIDKIILNSTSEGQRYSKELGIELNKFMYVPLGENLVKEQIDIKMEKDILFAAGFSNRDFKFLVDTLKDCEYSTYIFGREDGRINKIVLSSEKVGNRISSILSKTKIVLVPLKENRESGQLTILHAMEAGIPVIATATDCMKDYIEDGVNGFLCPNVSEEWLDRIELLYRDDKLYNEMSNRCKEIYYQKHTRYAMGKNVGEIIVDNL